MTITEFVLARITEDEEAARKAARDGARWRTSIQYGPAVTIDDGSEWGGDPVVYDEGSPTEDQAAHIAHYDPARVLAECEAKRRIVEYALQLDGDYPGVAGPSADLLPMLASVYADHPDFDPAWRM